MLRRTFAAVAVVFALGGVGAGCGGDDDGSASPRELLDQAAAKTVEAGSSKLSIQVASSGAGTEYRLGGEGSVDYRSRDAAYRFDVPSLGTVELLQDDKVLYLKTPRPLQPGKPWLKVDLEALAGKGSEEFQALVELQENSDPTSALSYLSGISGDVREEGAEDVRGARTRHFSMTVDLEKAIEASSDRAKEGLQKLLRQFGSKQIPAEVWVDDDGRARRITTTVDLANLEVEGISGVEGKLTTTLEFFDFGTKVAVTPPPAAETLDYKVPEDLNP